MSLSAGPAQDEDDGRDSATTVNGRSSMRVFVVHASQFGATRGIAERITEVLGRHGLAAEMYPVTQLATLAMADAVVIGSAVHAGHWLDDATRFVYRHQDALRAMPVWLFSSGPLGDRAVKAPQADPKEVAAFRVLLEPRGVAVFPGAYDRETADFSHMGLGAKLAGRLMPEGDWRDWDAIDRWADAIAESLLAASVTRTEDRPLAAR
jgi:menaquinone-dependent protoporphyrinogen oxidase